jgi:YidC/Oxa1 family membrane protein insertase
MSAVAQLFHQLLSLLGRGVSFFYDLIPNYGVAIILLTAAVRLVMLPLTIKQTKSMQEMQKLQPEVKKLQVKYKGDKAKLNEEMMKLYKEHQVNPLGGCLPLILQLPVFFALYRVLDGCGKTMRVGKAKTCAAGYVGTKYLPAGSALERAIHLGKAGFLGMNLGLSPVAALHQGGLVHALPYYTLVLLMVASTWYQQKQIQAVSTGQQAQQMQMVGKIMPLFLGVLSLNLATGISVYWVASNLWTIGQQRFILGKTAAPEGGPGSGGGGGGDGGKPKPPAPKPAAAKQAPAAKDAGRDSKTADKVGSKSTGGRAQGDGEVKSKAPEVKAKASEVKAKASEVKAKASEVKAKEAADGTAPGNGQAKAPASGNGRGTQRSASSGSKPSASPNRPRSPNARKRRRR